VTRSPAENASWIVHDGEAADETQDSGEITLLDLALVLAENLRLLIFVPLVAGLTALGIGFLITPTFTATTRILPPVQQQGGSAMLAAQLGALTGGLGAGAAAMASLKSPMDQYVALLKSSRVLDVLIDRFDMRANSKSPFMVDLRASLSGRTRIDAGIKDGIIAISVDDADPVRAAQIANAYVEELLNLMKTLAITEPAQRRLFFEAQLKQTKDNLSKAEIALQGSGIGAGTLKTVPQAALEASARIRAQLTVQEIRLASMRTFMTEANPDLRIALQELAALRSELAKAEQGNTVKSPGEGAQYVTRYRDFKYHETLFDLIAKQYELARLDEAREGTLIQVLEEAAPPERKSRPNKAVNAVITTFAVLFLMIIIVFLRHAFRNMRQDGESARKLLRLGQLLRLRRA